MKVLHAVDNFIGKIEVVIIIVLLSGMLSLGFLQVLLRNFMGSGITWADVFLRHLVLWVGLLGASLATKNDRHINMDALSRILSPKAKNILGIFLNLVAAVVTATCIYAGYFFVQNEYSVTVNEPLFLGIPAWVVLLTIPLAFVTITFRFLLKSLDKIAVLLGKQKLQAQEQKE